MNQAEVTEAFPLGAEVYDRWGRSPVRRIVVGWKQNSDDDDRWLVLTDDPTYKQHESTNKYQFNWPENLRIGHPGPCPITEPVVLVRNDTRWIGLASDGELIFHPDAPKITLHPAGARQLTGTYTWENPT